MPKQRIFRIATFAFLRYDRLCFLDFDFASAEFFVLFARGNFTEERSVGKFLADRGGG